MALPIFIQNEAGSDLKNYHDEVALQWQRAVRVSRPYPFPYGFTIGTAADDGCCVDCFVLTSRMLHSGEIVSGTVVGLMEQFENGQIDHNVLACLDGENMSVDEDVRTALTDFVEQVFAHVCDPELPLVIRS